jgi:hypothetical protein
MAWLLSALSRQFPEVQCREMSGIQNPFPISIRLEFETIGLLFLDQAQ